MNDALEELKVLINAETAPLRKEMKRVQQEVSQTAQVATKEANKIGGAFSGLKGILGKALVGLGLAKLGAEAIELSSNIQEVQNVVEVAFGTMAPLVDKFSKDAIANFGMSELAFKRTASTLMAMSNGMGFMGREAADMAIEVTKLTGDMSSFFNVSQDIAETALKGIWTGETEALKRFGVVMTQANLQQFAMRNGMNSNIQAMTQQEQLLLRYNFVMDSLKLAQGDFARTQDSWANQTRILSEQFKVLLSIVGSGLIAALTPAIRVINQLLSSLITVAKAIGSVFGKMFGLNKAVASTVPPIQNLGGLGAKGINNLGSAAEKAGKKAKGALAPFDELNVLTQDIGSASGSVGDALGGSVGGASIPSFDISDIQVSGELDSSPLENALQSLLDRLQPFISTISSIDLTPLSNSFANLQSAIDPILTMLGNSLVWFMNEIVGPFMKWVTEEVAPVGIDLITNSLKILTPILESTGKAGRWLYETFLQPILSFTADVFVNTLKAISDALAVIGDWMSANQPVVDAITFSVGAFFLAWKLTEIMAFIQMSGGIVAALGTLATAISGVTIAKLADKAETIAITALYAKDFLVSLVNGTLALGKQALAWGTDAAVKAASTTATWAQNAANIALTATTWALNGAIAVLTSPITIVVAAIAGLIAIGYTLIKNWDSISEWAGKTWDGIVSAFSSAASWFNDNVVAPITNFFGNMWDGIKNMASNAWNGIVSLFSAGGEFFSGIVGGIGDVFKAIINGLIGGINWVIAQPFNAINWALEKLKGINILGARPFDWISLISVPQIPKLAIGTDRVLSDGLAMIHKGEAVVPANVVSGGFTSLTNNDQQIELLKEQNRLLLMLLDKDTNVYLDGDKVSEKTKSIQDRLNTRFNY